MDEDPTEYLSSHVMRAMEVAAELTAGDREVVRHLDAPGVLAYNAARRALRATPMPPPSLVLPPDTQEVARHVAARGAYVLARYRALMANADALSTAAEAQMAVAMRTGHRGMWDEARDALASARLIARGARAIAVREAGGQHDNTQEQRVRTAVNRASAAAAAAAAEDEAAVGEMILQGGDERGRYERALAHVEALDAAAGAGLTPEQIDAESARIQARFMPGLMQRWMQEGVVMDYADEIAANTDTPAWATAEEKGDAPTLMPSQVRRAAASLAPTVVADDDRNDEDDVPVLIQAMGDQVTDEEVERFMDWPLDALIDHRDRVYDAIYDGDPADRSGLAFVYAAVDRALMARLERGERPAPPE